MRTTTSAAITDAPSDSETVYTANIFPSPENDKLYQPIDRSDPEFLRLVDSVRQHNGVLEPIVVSRDSYIISGHRRHAACVEAGLTHVSVRRLFVSREDSPDEFLKLLREYNRQRVKTLDERAREEFLDVTETDAYEHLKEYRRRKSNLSGLSMPVVEAHGIERRARISTGKQAMLKAAVAVITSFKNLWPISVRQVHYAILNAPPLRHSKKPDSTYLNDRKSYNDLSNLLLRARLAGVVPWEAIIDETRPITLWDVHAEPGGFIRQQAEGFLVGYNRNLLQSQSVHIEIMAEKLTVQSIVRRVASEYTIPVSIGRGYCSGGPRKEMVDRFRSSGKDKLVLLILSDHDPDGMAIGETYVKSILRDFKLKPDQIYTPKVAIHQEQVDRFALPAKLEAKKTSSRFNRFKKKHGTRVWELEALAPDVLDRELRTAVESVLDMEAYEYERQREARDARLLESYRRALMRQMQSFDFSSLLAEGEE